MALDKMLQAGLSLMASFLDSVTGAILLQLGDVQTDEVDSDKSESWQHVGFASRPAKAEPRKGACEVVAIKRADHDIVIASRDLRHSASWADILEGGTVVYSVGPDGTAKSRILLRGDGNVVIEAGSNTITIMASGDVAIGQGAADYVALASKVDANFAAIKSGVKSWVTVPNDGGAAGKAALTTALKGITSVASTKVKSA